MEFELRSQKIWGWQIVVYLFLGGLGGGCYLVGVFFDLFTSGYYLIARVGVLLGAPIVLIGTFFLLVDLGRPNLSPRAFFRLRSSWISRGTLILSAFIILGALHIVFWIWPFDWLIEEIAVRKALGAINGFFALLTILYTGLLLGTFRPIPFWCNPLLPVLFLISGLSTGLMATRLGVVLWNLTLISTKHPSLAILTVFEETLILAEGMAVYFYLQGSHILVASRASVAKVVWGDLSTAFWIGFVLLGLVVPFGMTVAEQVSSFGSKGSSIILTVLLTVPGLVGGYVLRHLIVAGGVKLPVNVEGIMVPLPPEV